MNSAMSLVEKLNTARIGRIDIKDENISNGEVIDEYHWIR